MNLKAGQPLFKDFGKVPQLTLAPPATDHGNLPPLGAIQTAVPLQKQKGSD